MDKRFPPPSDTLLNAVSLLMQVVGESAKLAEENSDHVGLRTTRTQCRYLGEVFDAILERQNGATVH